MSAGTVNQVMKSLIDSVPNYQKAQFDPISNCEKLLQMGAHGQVHDEILHQLTEDSGWYESRFDLLENPYTGDVEAIVIINDVTDEVREEQVVSVLMKIDYESVLTLGAGDGTPHQIATHSAGSGLGLSIAKSLVELMGGHMEVESELASGQPSMLPLLSNGWTKRKSERRKEARRSSTMPCVKS